jgi:23S rRNA pseudouridine2605 synthase
LKLRLQKVLAAAGLASRRASERIILAGRVAVNGQTVSQLGVQVDPDEDRVTVDGRPIRSRRKLYVALNKPQGYLCTRRDPERRHTVGELLPSEWADVYPVGRLDYDTEGLVFLTNDGEFCLRLTHPRYGVPKRYRVTVDGRIEPAALQLLTRGVVHTGERLVAQQAWLVHANPSHSVLELVLTEGKNREVRRLCESQGWRVRQLRRTQVGPVKLGELRPGKWRLLAPSEVGRLVAEARKPGTPPAPDAADRPTARRGEVPSAYRGPKSFRAGGRVADPSTAARPHRGRGEASPQQH